MGSPPSRPNTTKKGAYPVAHTVLLYAYTTCPMYAVQLSSPLCMRRAITSFLSTEWKRSRLPIDRCVYAVASCMAIWYTS